MFDVLKVKYIPIVIMIISSSVFLVVSTIELIKLSKTVSKFLYNMLLLVPVLMV